MAKARRSALPSARSSAARALKVNASDEDASTTPLEVQETGEAALGPLGPQLAADVGEDEAYVAARAAAFRILARGRDEGQAAAADPAIRSTCGWCQQRLRMASCSQANK